MVFSLPTTEESEEPRESLINKIKTVLTVHHSELVCARHEQFFLNLSNVALF